MNKTWNELISEKTGIPVEDITRAFDSINIECDERKRAYIIVALVDCTNSKQLFDNLDNLGVLKKK